MKLSTPPLPPSTIEALHTLGITSTEALHHYGSVRAFLMLKALGHTVTERLLISLDAAAQALHWSDISPARRQQLHEQLRQHPPVAVPPPPAEAQRWMLEALNEADRAMSESEVPVGAVVVYQGEIIGRGYNQPIQQHDPSAHAELLALRDAAKRLENYRLSECDLYVTLEPCPMCAGAILNARIARVIYGAPDLKMGASGSVVNLFADRRLNTHTAVQGGILSEQCLQKLQDFFYARRHSASRTSTHRN